MPLNELLDININEVLQKGLVTYLFKPIYSLKQHEILAVEGVLNGIQPDSGNEIPEDILFKLASDRMETLKLDRFYREVILNAFKIISSNEPNLMLMLKFEASVIDEGVAGSGILMEQVKSAGLKPEEVVIVIKESKVLNTGQLIEFSNYYRDKGFLIGLDDVGSRYSNLERIASIKPNVILTHPNLVSDIDTDYHKKQILGSLIDLSHETGAMVVCKGVETDMQAVIATEIGADMLLGHLVGDARQTFDVKGEYMKNLLYLPEEFKRHVNNKIVSKVLFDKKITEIFDISIKKLLNTSFENPEAVFKEIMEDYHELECMFSLDENGMQISDTVCKDKNANKRNGFFHPALCGNDHSLKEYYYNLADNYLFDYKTKPYISFATGNICVTCSRAVFNPIFREKLILCLDIKIS